MTFIERSLSQDNTMRQMLNQPKFTPYGAVTVGPRVPSPINSSPVHTRVTSFTPSNSRHLNYLKQVNLNAFVHDPYARTYLREESSSLDTSEEIVAPSPLTRTYINGRPVPTFASGELVYSLSAASI